MTTLSHAFTFTLMPVELVPVELVPVELDIETLGKLRPLKKVVRL
jgi:hypothetical protein